MGMVPQAPVLSHWCKLIEDFQISPLEFYGVIEEAVKRREVPNIEISRVDWNEGGVFSARREYFRVSRGKYVFDICGAPFGTGFFVSSWLAKPESLPWVLALILIFFTAAVILSFCISIAGFFGGLFLFVLLFPALFWVLTQVMKNQEGWDDSIVAIPIFGPIYQRIFRPETYYKIDTIQMFQQAVHNAVLEAVDRVTSAKGVRGLSELERKPTLMGVLTQTAGT